MPAAIPRNGHQIPRTSPNAPANSQAARCGKYFNGTPTTSWITCTIFGSRRSFPSPENAAIAARTMVTTRYAISMTSSPYQFPATYGVPSDQFPTGTKNTVCRSGVLTNALITGEPGDPAPQLAASVNGTINIRWGCQWGSPSLRYACFDIM